MVLLEVGEPELRDADRGERELLKEDSRAGSEVSWNRGGIAVSFPGKPSVAPGCALWECRWAEPRPPEDPDLPGKLRDELAELLDLTPEEVACPAELWEAISVKGAAKPVAKLYRRLLGGGLNPSRCCYGQGPGSAPKGWTLAAAPPSVR